MSGHRLGREQRVDGSPCTNCGTVLNAASAIDADYAPQPGDFTICIRCGHLMIFGEGGRLRDPNDDEMHRAAGDPRIIAAQRARTP